MSKDPKRFGYYSLLDLFSKTNHDLLAKVVKIIGRVTVDQDPGRDAQELIKQLKKRNFYPDLLTKDTKTLSFSLKDLNEVLEALQDLDNTIVIQILNKDSSKWLDAAKQNKGIVKAGRPVLLQDNMHFENEAGKERLTKEFRDMTKVAKSLELLCESFMANPFQTYVAAKL